MARCRWGKLKNPKGRRRCKKAPRGKLARASAAYAPAQLGRSRRRRRR